MEKPHRGPGSVALPPSAPRQHHGARRAADSRVAADPRAPAGRSRRSHAALCQPLPVAERHLPLPLPSPAGPAPPLPPPSHQPFEPTSCGFIHLDLKYLPPLHRQRTYCLCGHRSCHPLCLPGIHPDRRGATAAAFLQPLPPALSPSRAHSPDR